MYSSVHVGLVQVPRSGYCLLFQTLRGAVDLVAADVALALENFESGAATSLSDEEKDTLFRRGYLTEESVEQEQQQARVVLGMAAKNLKRGCEMIFRFGSQPRQEWPARANTSDIEEFFSVWDGIGAEGLRVTVLLDVEGTEIDGVILEQILASANRRDYSVIPTVTPGGMEALHPWVQSQNFQFIAVEANNSNMLTEPESLSNSIVSYYERQVYVGMKCYIDGMSEEQLKAVVEVRDRVRHKYPFFMAWLESKKMDGTQEPEAVCVNGTRVPYISLENTGVLRTLFRFITSPRSVNYTPFFQPEPSKLFLDIATNRISYESAEDGTVVEGLDSVRERLLTDFRQESQLLEEERSGGCLSCKYALVCGRRWIEEYGYGSTSDCAAALERRIRQVLPSLLHNLRGNVRPPGAGEPENLN